MVKLINFWEVNGQNCYRLEKPVCLPKKNGKELDKLTGRKTENSKRKKATKI